MTVARLLPAALVVILALLAGTPAQAQPKHLYLTRTSPSSAATSPT